MRSAQRGSLVMTSMLRPVALRTLGSELAGAKEIVENSLSDLRQALHPVQVDPHGQQVGAQRAHQRAVEAWQRRQSSLRVIVWQQEGGSRAPAAPNANANPAVRLDVSDVVGRLAVVGHEPERGADESPAYRRVPRPPPAAAPPLPC